MCWRGSSGLEKNRNTWLTMRNEDAIKLMGHGKSQNNWIHSPRNVVCLRGMIHNDPSAAHILHHFPTGHCLKSYTWSTIYYLQCKYPNELKWLVSRRGQYINWLNLRNPSDPSTFPDLYSLVKNKQKTQVPPVLLCFSTCLWTALWPDLCDLCDLNY